jgi:hypothetical protein
MLSVAALLAGVGAAGAQNAAAQQVVQMAPGFVLVVPAGTVVQNAAPVAMPDPVAMIREMDAQMAQMDAQMQAQLQQAAALQAAMPAMPVGNGAYSGVVVTSFSDGQHSCTERVVYPASGAAEKVQVSETGNACGSLGAVPGVTPTAAPIRAVPIPTAAPALQKPAPLVIADNN